MSEKPCMCLAEAFSELSDPRVEGRCDPKLLEILIIAVRAVLTGAESWVETETFGVMIEAWLRIVLELPGGTPSHDTFGRVFAALDATAFQVGDGFFGQRWKVETVISVMKRKSGDVMRSAQRLRQRRAVAIKALIYNLHKFTLPAANQPCNRAA